MIKLIISKFDKFLCRYFGLQSEEAQPIEIKLVHQDLLINNTFSFKRHLIQESWTEFTNSTIKQTTPENLEKIGLAAGQVLAKNLLISFENPSIKSE